MGFILRIFFSGLIAFIPSEDGKELTVLLINAPQAHHASSGVPEHKPVLLARAAACSGDCPRANTSVATFLYPGASSRSAANDALALAIDKGVVWQLAGSDLSLGIPRDGVRLAHTAPAGKRVPDNAAERADFRWVANLKEMDPDLGKLDPAVLAEHPPEELIVARLKLTSGEVSTYSVVQVNGDVIPIDFRSSTNVGKPYLQAVASWVEAEIRVPGDQLEIVEQRFAGGPARKMSLKPSKGMLDVAVLNVSRPTGRARTSTPAPGLHFSRYWDLAADPPAFSARPIPQVPRIDVEKRDFAALHDDEHKSQLLEKIFPGGRGPYDQILCPMSQYPKP